MFDFYSELLPDSKKKYELMLDTHYIMLMCDLGLFLEEDEKNKKLLSASWIYSIQKTLDAFGFNPESYPQGSISANRSYYESLMNYLGDTFPADYDFTIIRKGIINFLKLRCDNNSQANTNMFGSYYKLVHSNARDNKLYRQVDINIRHSVTALWLLSEESQDVDSRFIKKAFLAINHRIDDFIDEKKVWNGDEFEHLTLSSTINACNSLINKTKDRSIETKATELKQKCELALLDKCLEQDELGYYYFKLPLNHSMSKFEFYLTYFTLSQVKYLLTDERIQSVIKRLLTNKIDSPAGNGIPIFPVDKCNSDKAIVPDFGTSGSLLSLLYYILDNEIGSPKWRRFCKTNFYELLDFCLNSFHDPNYYHLPMSENHAKILLLPNYSFSPNKLRFLNIQIQKLKDVIGEFHTTSGSDFSDEIQRVDLDDNFTHLPSMIAMWELKSNNTTKEYDMHVDTLTRLGAFSGSFFMGAVKTLFDL